MAATIIVAAVGLVAVGAWLVAVWSCFQAWRISERHPPYRALGLKRFVNWMGAIRYMPDEAMPHLKRLYLAIAVFFVAVIAGIVTGAVSTRS
ncbi:hypothetical protein [Phreatobacter sp.]|uniref:hypothetical protein n=1 Tax=Phreatobacter sp. TaxID=1966341 RepID=UPI003F6FF4EA